MDIKQYIASIPGFPKEGINFSGRNTNLEKSRLHEVRYGKLSAFAKEVKADLIIAPEARGFFFGIPVALECHVGFAPVRKPGKLPRETMSQTYQLEYGVDELQMHVDAIQKGMRVVIIDDLLATGGTVEAMIKMVGIQTGNRGRNWICDRIG